MFYTARRTNVHTRERHMDLTERQRTILTVIADSVRAQGYPPTVREIGLAVGLSSPASVQSHLAQLEAKGYIRRGTSKRRALELVHPPRGVVPGADETGLWGQNGVGRLHSLPVVGAVAAGRPVLASEDVEDHVEVPTFIAHDRECFVLRVRGSSMVNAGILDGDLVVVRRQQDAENGDIVVALLGDEATLKRFFRERDHVRLQPENDAMEPIITADPRIVGRVTGVMRRV